MKVRNLFDGVPPELPDELKEQIAGGAGVRIERIVSRGHASPEGFWYDQDEDEWVMLVSGSAGIAFEGRKDLVVLAPGDHLSIPAHCRHRVEWTNALLETVWLAVFYPPAASEVEPEEG
jgi:cupin 2 domain-containing protein